MKTGCWLNILKSIGVSHMSDLSPQKDFQGGTSSVFSSVCLLGCPEQFTVSSIHGFMAVVIFLLLTLKLASN
ncbi:mCG148202 [Mus musculus]|nr:mCG148202 [Mus musculus]